MHKAVELVWEQFNSPIEGRLNHMYLDIKGLVTCGVGNLIDPVSEALKLTWHKKDGSVATDTEVAVAWRALKARQDLARRGAHHAAALTGLALLDSEIDALVQKKLKANEQYLLKTFPNFDSFPADGQLGILSMAWAAGPGFTKKFPSFTRAVLSGDWTKAVEECTLQEAGNPGVVPRNRADRLCFANAAIVTKCGMPIHELWWSQVATPRYPMPVEQVREIADLSGVALEDARLYSLEITRHAAHLEMRNEDEPTNPVNFINKV